MDWMAGLLRGSGGLHMKIGIIGAGSIGLLLGSFLAEAGIDVILLARREEQAALIRKKGICRINADRKESTFNVHATIDMRQLSEVDICIVAVKYTGVKNVLAQLREANVRNPMLFIQNGIAHMDLSYATDLPDIAFATVEHGALRIDGRTVSHNGIGMLTIAVGRGRMTPFEVIEKAKSDTFPISWHTDVEEMLMRKVLINCMINPLTAILKVKNGELITNSHCNKLFETLYMELATVFTDAPSYEIVTDVCRNTARNQSSMLSDYLAGRPMEIETIVTAIIERAETVGRQLPFLSTLETMLLVMDGKEAKL